jgi:hypothetical protein
MAIGHPAFCGFSPLFLQVLGNFAEVMREQQVLRRRGGAIHPTAIWLFYSTV